MTLPADIGARLAGVFGDDERLGWLPPEPAALQLHLRAGGSPGVVAGYDAGRFDELDRCVERCLADADATAMWRRWVAAAGPLLDAGLQLESDRRLQVYLRGHFALDAAIDSFRQAGQAPGRLVLENALALFARRSIDMIGIGLQGGGSAAVYLSVLHNLRRETEALAESLGFLIAALAPEARDRWEAARDRLLASDGPERVYISFEPVERPGWIKVDVGRRSLAAVAEIAAELGTDAGPLVAAARSARLTEATQVGLKLGPEPQLSTYHSLVGGDV